MATWQEAGPGGKPEPEAEPTAHPDPTQLSALLQELARTPPAAAEGAEASHLRPGDVVGKFTIVRELGRGGFGVVHEAVDEELGRRVAFKALRPRRALRGQGEEWLRREAEAVARLQHPAIVTLHDFGRGPTGPYLIFELLRGETLQERLRAGPLPVREAVRVARAVAQALAHAHASGVLHRDMKPSNVFLCRDGAVKVLDFGLARLFERADAQSGGTPAYMAPEQWRSEPEDARTDLFALGATLHETLSGSAPYRATRGHGEVLEEGPAPRLPGRGVPARLRRLVSRMLERDRARRPQGAAEVAAELAAIEDALTAGRARLAAAAAALAALAVIGWLAVREPAPGPLRVAVADVLNETGDAGLDALSGLVGKALELSRRVRVIPRSDLADLAVPAGAPPALHVDAAAALAVARDGSADAVLAPEVRRDGGGWVVRLRALDPRGGGELFALEDRSARREAIPTMVDRVAEKVRLRLRERESDVRVSLVAVAQAATGSLDAYHDYFEGEQLLTRGETENSTGWSDALALFQRAARLDPGFAMAHYRVAYVQWSDRQDASAAIARARATQVRASERDRAFIAALDAFIAGRTDEARERYQALLRAWPGDKEAALDLSRLLASREGHRDFAQAASWARVAVESAPRSGLAWEQLLDCVRLQGRYGPLVEEARRYARALPSAAAYTWLGSALLADGKVAEAAQAFHTEAQVIGPAGVEGLAALRVREGELDAAEAEYRRLAASEEPGFAREGRYGLSWVSAYRGQYREAARRLEPVVAAAADRGDAADRARALGQQALWLTLATGRLAEEPVQAGRAALRSPAGAAVVQRHFYWFAEQAALLAGRRDVAEALEREGGALGSSHLSNLVAMTRAHAEGRDGDARAEAAALRDPSDLGYGYHVPLAAWSLEAGELDRALAEASRAVDLPLWPHPDAVGFRASVWPRALLLRARIQLRRGDRAAARRDLEVLRALWKEADAGAPDVVEARALWRSATSPR